MATVQEMATLLAGAFETRHRPDGETFTALRDDAPEWMRDAVHAAHGDMLPDDGIFRMCESAAECIAEADDPEDAAHEWADGEVSCYHAARVAWLAAAPITRLGRCDDALEEHGSDAARGVSDLIALGWYTEARDVFGAILGGCEAAAYAAEDAEAGTEGGAAE